MAFLTGATGAFMPQPRAAPESFYSQAVFRAYDNDPSTSASSASLRLSPAAASSNTRAPAPHSSQSSTRPHPRSNARHESSINPSEVEMAEGLIQMRSGVVPMTASPQAHFAHETPTRQDHSHLHPAAPPARGPVDHPTISKSLDELSRWRSDDLSLGDKSDTTITDPQVDAPQGILPVPPRPGLVFIPGHEPGLPPQTPSAKGSTALHFEDTPREGSTLALPSLQQHSVAPRPHTQSPRSRPYDPSAPIPSASIAPPREQRCHCHAVPQAFFSMLDDAKSTNIEALAKLYSACRTDLCPVHLNSYAQLVTSALEATHPVVPRTVTPQPTAERAQQMDQHTFSFEETGTGTRWTAVPRRRRATSIPGIEEIELDLPSKRRRLDFDEEWRPHHESLEPQPQSKAEAQSPSDNFDPFPKPQHTPGLCRPQLDVAQNEDFRRRVLAELAHEFTDLKEDDWSRGETTNRYIHAILTKCEHPNTDVRKGPVDAGFLNSQEAATILERGTERLPIITTGQQQFKWTGSDRPIAQLFRRMEDLSRQVSVQIPSHNFDLPSYETKSLSAIRERFLRGQVSRDPWNVLDLRSPLPPAILPSFLTGENCQLLPRIRDALLEGHCAERIKASKEEWNEWTELLEWVLMSEGGHNTAPHMDSHGWSTWITIQEGNFGFGWLSRPTDKEQEDWMNDPLNYTGGNWRFVILKPGQTVFFPSGTVHFVFRLHAQQTLALGGHLLQWTALERWVQIILWQLKNPNITNEDLGTAPLKYIRSARKLVENRIANYHVSSMGGMSTVTRFMALATEVERWFNQKKKKKRAR